MTPAKLCCYTCPDTTNYILYIAELSIMSPRQNIYALFAFYSNCVGYFKLFEGMQLKKKSLLTSEAI